MVAYLISLAAKKHRRRKTNSLFVSFIWWPIVRHFFKLCSCCPDFFPRLLKPPKRKVIACNKLALLLLFRLLFCGRNRGDREAFIAIFAFKYFGLKHIRNLNSSKAFFPAKIQSFGLIHLITSVNSDSSATCIAGWLTAWDGRWATYSGSGNCSMKSSSSPYRERPSGNVNRT